ncbi:MAG: SPOR domain-containing protein [Arenicellales bacterium]
MAQARRKKQAKANPRRRTNSNAGPVFATLKRGFGLFSTGALVGVLATLLWQGYQSEDQADLGSGLKAMIRQSQLQEKQRAEQFVPPVPVLIDRAPRVKPEYDFYTVLPEIEEVLPPDFSPPEPEVITPKPIVRKAVKARAAPVQVSAASSATGYILQVASYSTPNAAERLKAKLALRGLRANIQKVTIGQKNFFRVRLGPYADYGSMTADDYQLNKMGHKPTRLKVSKAG